MIDLKLSENEFLAFRVDQPFGSFFTVKLTAEFLLERSYSKSADLIGDEITGSQRKLRSRRMDEIRDFIDSDEASFPNSIILAANYDSDDVLADEDDRWTVEAINEELSLYKLKIPSTKKVCSVVDGQHRLFSFERSKNKDMQLNCSLFLDLVPSLQASVFATINFNQSPVDKSLAYNLFGYQLDTLDSEYWSPDLLAVNLCRFFSENEDSFFYGHINYRLAQRNVQEKYWVISTASFVDGVVSLISKNPKEDRYKINRKGMLGLAGRKVLSPDDEYALRQYYISGNDVAIKQAIDIFFSSLQSVFNIADDNKHVLVSTIGIKALFKILGDYLKINGVNKTSLSEVNKYFERLKKIDLDNRQFFSSSTKGQKRLYNCMYSVFFDVNIDSLARDDELAEYRKVLNPS
ncbi:DGQHR domain-containing protein [Vibrio parahaemolyticus]|nr:MULTISPECIES: DGQHR domain-containing protein [Vibrio]MCR9645965.1 DGQHR domain-containing protein [Vibrio parahaemolyticus]MDF4526828.1 DGQHR domain-containing protein [Vibrio parahaemolyticus]MDF4553983.1 DGQHR domain-containing protein [Vibrio parahaemolyticus]RZP96580.1 DGQHR domain-containing protein [Vibrio vulnificus]